MTGAQIIAGLGGRWSQARGEGFARCPVHANGKERTPSLHVSEKGGTLLLRCFAGCEQADVIEALRARGLWPDRNSSHEKNIRARRRPAPGPAEPDAAVEKRSAAALAIWRAAAPAANTLVETYLASRGITLPLPPSIRFASGLEYRPSGIRLPAMVAAVQNAAGRMIAIHRTFLRMDGSGKANVAQPRLCLGPITGCAVRLAPPAGTLCWTEGIEDALALMQMTGRPAWAVLGTAGFKNATPPAGTRAIILAPDADAGGDGVVDDAATRLAGMGLRVLHLRPPEGSDWCDLPASYEERAAVLEYDAGAARADAELQAFAEIIGGEVRGA